MCADAAAVPCDQPAVVFVDFLLPSAFLESGGPRLLAPGIPSRVCMHAVTQSPRPIRPRSDASAAVGGARAPPGARLRKCMQTP